jgi:hypothetical protein
MRSSSIFSTLALIAAFTTCISNSAERSLSKIIDQLSWRTSDLFVAQDMKRNEELTADFEAGLRARDAACPKVRGETLLFCSDGSRRQTLCVVCGVAGSCLTCCAGIATRQCAANYGPLSCMPFLAGLLCGMADSQHYSSYFRAPLAKLLCCLCCEADDTTGNENDTHKD